MEAAQKNQDLAKIGIEAFAALDEHQRHLKNGGARHYHYNPNGREVLDCFQAAKKFGGVGIIEHRAKKKPALQPAIHKHF